MTLRRGTEKHKLQFVAKIIRLSIAPINSSTNIGINTLSTKLQHMNFLAPIKTGNMHKENNFRTHDK